MIKFEKLGRDYTGIRAEHNLKILANGEHVGYICLNQLLNGNFFVEWVEILRAYQGKSLLRPIFLKVMENFETEELELEAREELLDKYKHLGATVDSYDEFREVYWLSLRMEG